MTKDEVLAIIQKLSGVHQLLIKLLYGTGLRLTEGLSLRVKDVDFAQNQIIARDTKGNESRVTMLPESIAEELKIHLQSAKLAVSVSVPPNFVISVKIIHQQDLQKGYGSVYLPFAKMRKYPSAQRSSLGTRARHFSSLRDATRTQRCLTMPHAPCPIPILLVLLTVNLLQIKSII
ncbi:tyrosine-type recombinase/integrase [Halotia wernerae UHCC 0503]|nr:tyrosine-type recombinase/integrase [Halotia wernerae UHCC 0503]